MKSLFVQGPSINARLILLVLLSIVLMALDHRQHLAQPVRATVAAAVYPIHFMVDLPFRVGDFFADQFGSRRELLEENARLRARQLLNEARLQRLDTLERENINLRALLQSAHKLDESVTVAELMRVNLDPHIHLVQINRGSSDNVYVGQPVLDARGVMGQIDRVGPVSSLVRLITDPSHALPVQVNRNGLRSIVMGTGDLQQLELFNVANNADLKEGDLLVTSGLGGRFPAGYPVAYVTSIENRLGEAFAHVTARPAAALDRGRQVLLVQGHRQTPPFMESASGEEDPGNE